jgi:hypothetical protein
MHVIATQRHIWSPMAVAFRKAILENATALPQFEPGCNQLDTSKNGLRSGPIVMIGPKTGE